MAGGIALQRLFLAGDTQRYWRLVIASRWRAAAWSRGHVVAAQERSEWPTGDAELEAEIAADWYGDADDMTIGDRRQEQAMIGTSLDESHWRAAFDACLVNDEEWSQASKGLLADPFPSWEMDEDDHDHDHDHHDHGDDCDCGAHGH